MPSDDVTLEVDGAQYPGRIDIPSGNANDGVLVLPGAGHGPFGDVFDRFAESASRDGFCVARFETWATREDLDAKTLDDHATEIRAGVDFLTDAGCSTIHVVAKSYSGRLALELIPETVGDRVDRMVLWAPAVIFGGHPETPTVEEADLESIAIPTRILQGDEDHIPVESAASIAEHMPNGDLVTLPGEDHSFQHAQERIVDKTLSFLDA